MNDSGRVFQGGQDSHASPSSALEDLHVYLTEEESYIQRLELLFATMEASQEYKVQELEERLEATEKAYQSRITALERQVDGLTVELSQAKRAATSAFGSRLARFLKKKRDEK